MSIEALTSALQAAEATMKAYANNIANAKTTGFKASDVHTNDLFYAQLAKAGTLENVNNARKPVGVQVGSGTRVSATARNLAQGEIKHTNNPLDIALTGPGYFAITMPNFRNGRAYTRDGSFKISADRTITTSSGALLDDNITIPDGIDTDKISIDRNGVLSVTYPDNTVEEIATIQLYNFPNEQGLEARGNNLLSETDGSGEAVPIDNQNEKFLQNALEKSNVSSIVALTEMIEVQRQHEMASRAMRIADDMAKKLAET